MTSPQLEWTLQTLLEQLNEDELKSFKSLLRALPLEDVLQKAPWSEVEEADGKKLAEILIHTSSENWIRSATVTVLEEMNLTELCKMAKSEMLEAGQVQEIDNPQLGDAEEDSELAKPGEKEGRRNSVQKQSLVWKNTFWQGDIDSFHDDVIQRNQRFIPFLNPRTPRKLTPYTVVLHGPAGVGKTTLAKKCMLDWTDCNLSPTVRYAFYLSCKELSRMGPCSFAELISKDWPELQDDIPHILAQAQRILFVVDGLDELKVPPGALIQDICGDWEQQKPVPVLLGSLLKRKMLPKATLLVTTRPRALRDLQLLVQQPIYIRVEGFLEEDRRAYFLRHFGDEDQAMRAFELMRSNAALFQLGSAPAVCWIVCTTLKLQMEKGEDPAPTCLTSTGLFLRFLCSQFPQGAQLRGALRALSLLAAQGLWAQMSVLHGEDLESAGVQESDLRPFLDRDILRQDGVAKGCYSFIHLSFQQFLTALFYALEKEEEEDRDGHAWDIGDVQKLLSEEERLKNPDLIQVGHFLFGLANEKRVKELEATFGCQMSPEIKQELLRCKASLHANKPLSMTDLKEVLCCLYESQEEELAKVVVAPLKKISINLTNTSEMMHCSFSLKHCRDLEKVSLQIAKGVFLENYVDFEPDIEFESSNSNLKFLEVKQSFLSDSSVRILCDHITRSTCHLQKVEIKNVTPDTAYRDFCLAFIGKRTLTHLTLEGHIEWERTMLLLLCDLLRNHKCNLQYLRLGGHCATSEQWVDFFYVLKANQSLRHLHLSASVLLDEGAKLLYKTMTHPKHFLQMLSLENCHLTEANCKDLAAVLVVSRELTHLCLAKNSLKDTGVKFLCEGLSYPECKLQALVLQQCSITKRGCRYLSEALQEACSLTNLDLSLNQIARGLWILCQALENPNCNLKHLRLWSCSLMPFYCQHLGSALISNQKLETLDLGQNHLWKSGIIQLFRVLRQRTGSLKTLRLKTYETNLEIKKLLEEVKEKNPKLTIDCNASGATAPACCDFFC
ncbi:NACHT, LRR and PYD domains-containing protein 7 isoform 1 [Macaca mulatta]|uniref:NLR family pyrin domain containing 7 isoform 1 n=1 Tax=Macaca mulatta TaxID=9544 RepID=B0FPF2_MACMU|nr:NACHT, LRR and PYD domains-containing protein 7 isoform 1 [Macaca mulatta]ABY58965.1 NLR family pyrin domain containing 7 isoform 1 [Macaca mulatta]